MNAYSNDLRLKVLDALDRGLPRKEVARLFGISLSTIKRYLKLREHTGDVTPKPSPGRTLTTGKSVEPRRALWAQLESNDDATLERHCELWEQQQGAKVPISTMSRAIRKLGWTHKKRVWEPPSETKKREVLGEIGQGASTRRSSYSWTNAGRTSRLHHCTPGPPKGERAYSETPKN